MVKFYCGNKNRSLKLANIPPSFTESGHIPFITFHSLDIGPLKGSKVLLQITFVRFLFVIVTYLNGLIGYNFPILKKA